MKSSFGKGRFPERNTTESMKIVESYKSGDKNEGETLTELYDVYFPKHLNLKYKNEVLGKIKSNEYTTEEGERKLHWFFRLPHEYVERSNANRSPKRNTRVRNNNKYNKNKGNKGNNNKVDDTDNTENTKVETNVSNNVSNNVKNNVKNTKVKKTKKSPKKSPKKKNSVKKTKKSPKKSPKKKSALKNKNNNKNNKNNTNKNNTNKNTSNE